MVHEIISDPDFEDFNGLYAGGPATPPPKSTYNYTELSKYMKKKQKSFFDLSVEEINQFRTK